MRGSASTRKTRLRVVVGVVVGVGGGIRGPCKEKEKRKRRNLGGTGWVAGERS